MAILRGIEPVNIEIHHENDMMNRDSPSGNVMACEAVAHLWRILSDSAAVFPADCPLLCEIQRATGDRTWKCRIRWGDQIGDNPNLGFVGSSHVLGFNKPIIWYFNFTTIENQTWQIF